MVQPGHAQVSVRRQCELGGLALWNWYYEPVEVSAEELALMRRIDRLYTQRPFYGSRERTLCPKAEGHEVNRERVQRLVLTGWR